MRVVQFTKSFHLGGTEGQVVELIRGLRQTHEVFAGVLEASGPHLGPVLNMGLELSSFPLTGSVARANTALQIGRLAWWLKQVRAELVHVHDFYSTLLVVPAARLARCKVVVGRLDLAHWHGPLRRRALSLLTARADHVIANAGAIRQMLIEEEGISPERVTVIHNGIDLQRFDARLGEPIASPIPAEVSRDDRLVVVHVANMNHTVKRQEDLLEAFAILKNQLPQLRLWLVGDGPRRGLL